MKKEICTDLFAIGKCLFNQNERNLSEDLEMEKCGRVTREERRGISNSKFVQAGVMRG